MNPQRFIRIFFLLSAASIGASQLFKSAAAVLWGIGFIFFIGAVVLVVKRGKMNDMGNSRS